MKCFYSVNTSECSNSFSRPGGTIFASCPYENDSKGAGTIYDLMNQQKEGPKATYMV